MFLRITKLLGKPPGPTDGEWVAEIHRQRRELARVMLRLLSMSLTFSGFVRSQ